MFSIILNKNLATYTVKKMQVCQTNGEEIVLSIILPQTKEGYQLEINQNSSWKMATSRLTKYHISLTGWFCTT